MVIADVASCVIRAGCSTQSIYNAPPTNIPPETVDITLSANPQFNLFKSIILQIVLLYT